MAKKLRADSVDDKSIAANYQAVIADMQRRIESLQQQQQQLKDIYLEYYGKPLLNLPQVGSLGQKQVKAKRGASSPEPAKVPGKRTRRKPEDLKVIALKVLAAIKKAGDQGISGKELRKKITGLGNIQSIIDLVNQHVGEGLVYSKGNKRSTKYFAK